MCIQYSLYQQQYAYPGLACRGSCILCLALETKQIFDCSMRLSHRTCTACPKLISYSSHSKQCCSHNSPIIKHRRRLHSVYKPQLDDVSTQEHYKSRRDALLSAVVLGAAALDNEQPAMARVQQQPQCQLDKLQWREHQRTLMHRMTGRRPIVVTLADIQADYDRYGGHIVHDDFMMSCVQLADSQGSQVWHQDWGVLQLHVSTSELHID